MIKLVQFFFFKYFLITVRDHAQWLMVCTPVAKKIHPFDSEWYEIWVRLPDIKSVKSHTTTLGFWLQTDMNDITICLCMIWNGTLTQHKTYQKSYHSLGHQAPNRYESDLSNEVLWDHVAYLVSKLHTIKLWEFSAVSFSTWVHGRILAWA